MVIRWVLHINKTHVTSNSRREFPHALLLFGLNRNPGHIRPYVYQNETSRVVRQVVFWSVQTCLCVIKSSVWQAAILSFQKAEPNMTGHHDCTFEKQVSHLWLVTRSAVTNLYISKRKQLGSFQREARTRTRPDSRSGVKTHRRALRCDVSCDLLSL